MTISLLVVPMVFSPTSRSYKTLMRRESVTVRKKNILLIAYYYPPFNNGGVQRIVNFKKYLPQYGCNVTILTSDAVGSVEDEKDVIRIRDKWQKYMGTSILPINFLFRAIKKIRLYFGNILDHYDGWVEEVKNGIEPYIKNGMYDYVIASYPPVACLEVGKYINEKYGIPLIVDYRDGFFYNPFSYILKLSSRCQKKMRSLESWMAKNAVLQIGVNQCILEYLDEIYPLSKNISVSNGFDDEEVIPYIDTNLPEGFNIVYTGQLGLSRMIYPIRTIARIIEINDGVNFIFMGDYSNEELDVLNLYSNVYIRSKASREYAINMQRQADMLLLISGEEKDGTSGKLYEYLFAKHPILNFGSDNIAGQIIINTDSGKTFTRETLHDIPSWIEDIKNNRLHYSYNNIKQYTRREECRYLAEMILSINDIQ